LPGVLALIALHGMVSASVYVAYVQDIGLASLASAFGAKGPWTGTWFLAPTIVFGGLVGLAFGVRRALASVDRSSLGWAAGLGPILLLALVALVGGKPGRVFAQESSKPEVVLASKEECKQATERALDRLSVSPGESGLPASFSSAAYLTSPEYEAELKQGTELCVQRKMERAEAKCYTAANDFDDILRCGPFWLDASPGSTERP
jgi:hypothetical protein